MNIYLAEINQKDSRNMRQFSFIFHKNFNYFSIEPSVTKDVHRGVKVRVK